MSITEYIGRDSEQRAKNLGRKLLDSTKRLTQFPLSGRMIPEYHDPELREVIVYRYRVMYLVEPGEITVFNVVHSRRGINPVDLVRPR